MYVGAQWRQSDARISPGDDYRQHAPPYCAGDRYPAPGAAACGEQRLFNLESEFDAGGHAVHYWGRGGRRDVFIE